MHRNFKHLALAVTALCCAAAAQGQTVTLEATGTVDSLSGGGWSAYGGKSVLGQSLALDFSYDSSAISQSIKGSSLIESASITSANFAGGAFGSGANLESGGPGKGSIVDTIDLTSGTVTATSSTRVTAPSKNFSGTVFGFSLFTNGLTTTLDVIRNVFSNGLRDARDSGTAAIANVSVAQVATMTAPEIDPSSTISALTLLAGAIVVLRAKKSSALPTA
jgi:hypothetical protein